MRSRTDGEPEVIEDQSSEVVLKTWDAVAEGGDPACWEHLICPERGVVLEARAHGHLSQMPDGHLSQ